MLTYGNLLNILYARSMRETRLIIVMGEENQIVTVIAFGRRKDN